MIKEFLSSLSYSWRVAIIVLFSITLFFICVFSVGRVTQLDPFIGYEPFLSPFILLVLGGLRVGVKQTGKLHWTLDIFLGVISIIIASIIWSYLPAFQKFNLQICAAIPIYVINCIPVWEYRLETCKVACE